jgi:hypothetical protein
MKILNYRLRENRNGTPLVALDSPIGNGQDFYPDNLRSLASALLMIADEAERAKIGKYERWRFGVVEMKSVAPVFGTLSLPLE